MGHIFNVDLKNDDTINIGRVELILLENTNLIEF